MLVRPLLLAATFVPQAALALPWDGTYRLSEGADCDRVGEEGGALRIGEGVLQGVGSTCRMTEPVDVLDLDATLYEMACEGEGQNWTERAFLMRAAEGDAIFLAWRGYVFRYDRCAETSAERGASANAQPDVFEAVETASESFSGPEDGAEEDAPEVPDGKTDELAAPEEPDDAAPED